MEKRAVSKHFFQFLPDFPQYVFDKRQVKRFLAIRKDPAKSALDVNNVDTKILIYEDRVKEWFLKIGKKLKRDNEAGFAILQIAVAYIEGNQQYREGKSSKDKKSGIFFKRAMKRLFPEISKIDNLNKYLDNFYDQVRCGLFHDGMTKSTVTISKEYGEALEIADSNIKINPHKFLDKVNNDFTNYIIQLKNKENRKLRIDFELRWDDDGSEKKKHVGINEEDLPKISELAAQKAKEHLDASILLKETNLSLAYVHLVFCLEEIAKSKMCDIYHNLSITNPGREHKICIKSKTLENMFWRHDKKHLTIIIQAIFDLINTFDENLRKKVLEALNKGVCDDVPELVSIMKVFKNIQEKRENIMYVGKKGEVMQITKEDFEDLYGYVQSSYERIGQFAMFTVISYDELEELVEMMLENYTEQR